MRHLAFALLVPCVSAFAQNFYVPDSDPTIGTCNSIPFNQTSSIYQTVVDAADLGSAAQVITGLGFAACGTGVHSYGSMEIVMDHTQAATLSSTFAQNLTASAQTVLQVTDHDWQVTQDTWNEIGLQRPFFYNGVDRVVIQVTFQNHAFQGSGSGSFHRDSRQRVYSNNWTTLPTTGASSNAAAKMVLSVVTAGASSFGSGCVGSNGLVPDASFTGTPQLGQNCSFDIANAQAASVCFLVTGSSIGAPFPNDLGPLGAPRCRQYFGIDGTFAAFTDAQGSGSVAVTVPNQPTLLGAIVYGQWACVDLAANTVGITTSDYVRVAVGN